MPATLLVLLFLAALLLPSSAQQPFYFQSFSCAVSTYTLKAGDAPYEVCAVNSTNSTNYLSMQWFTGTFDKPYGSESVLISM
jgi:hypothetical protein